MKLTKSKLKQIIKEELKSVNKTESGDESTNKSNYELTKEKLQQTIEEEISKILREGKSPFEKYSLDTMSDGTTFATLIDEPDDYDMGQLPSKRVADLGDGAWSMDAEEYADAATLELALDNELGVDPAEWAHRQPIPREKGPAAGSMPFSQSPAYSDKEKAAIKSRRIRMGYGGEYKQ